MHMIDQPKTDDEIVAAIEGEAPEKTEEQIRIAAIKEAAKNDICASAELYIKTRNPDLLVHIQEVVDELNDAFVMSIPQKDGYPVCVTFNPRESVPTIPTSAEGDQGAT